MSFFGADPAPEEPAPVEHRPPPWSQPPENMLPAAVPLDLALARTYRLAVWVGSALAYPDGVAFDLVIVRRAPAGGARRGHPFFLGPGDADGPHFGIGFADGRRAVTRGGRRGEGPTLVHNGGGGSDRRWQGRMWLWPLPPPGELTFAFAWPEEGAEETLAVIDAAPLVSAAGRAVELWPEDRPPYEPGGIG